MGKITVKSKCGADSFEKCFQHARNACAVTSKTGFASIPGPTIVREHSAGGAIRN